MAEFVTAYVGPNNVGSELPGTGNWSNIGDIYSKNGIGSSTTGLAVGADSFTVTASFTAGLTAQNIPGDAIIRGIEVIVWAKGPGFGDAPTTTKARFITPITTEKSVAGNWSGGSFSARSFGSPTDLWGGVWTRDTVLNSKFGVQVTNGSSTGYTYEIDYIEMRVHWDAAPPPTLSARIVERLQFINGVPSNTPVGTTITDIYDQTPGSTLSLRPTTDSFLVLEGTEIKIGSPITRAVGTDIQIDLRETLIGASNSPFDFRYTLYTAAPTYSRFVASSSGTTTPVLPAHQAGDLLVCFLFRDGSTTAPALPAGWTTAATGTGTACSYRLAYKIATSSSESGGTATTATSTITSVYRPTEGYTLTIGGTSQANAASSSINYQSLTMQDTSGKSTVGAFVGHRSTNTTLEKPPAGMVLRQNVNDATDEASAFDTNGHVTSWGATSVNVGGTSSGWISIVYEIKVTSPITRKAPRYSSWL